MCVCFVVECCFSLCHISLSLEFSSTLTLLSLSHLLNEIMLSRLSFSRLFRTPVATKQIAQCFSSRVVLTGNDIISPTIGLNEDQKEFYDLAKQVSVGIAERNWKWYLAYLFLVTQHIPYIPCSTHHCASHSLQTRK